MAVVPPAVTARGRLPGFIRSSLLTWASLAAVGVLAGLALAATSLLNGAPSSPALTRLGEGLVYGAAGGSLLAAVMLAVYQATRAVLRLGRRLLRGGPASRSTLEPAAASRPIWTGVGQGLVGSLVGVVVGSAGCGALGFLAVTLWIALTPTAPEVQAQASFWAVVFGLLWGVPAGVLAGFLAVAMAGFAAGLRPTSD